MSLSHRASNVWRSLVGLGLVACGSYGIELGGSGTPGQTTIALSSADTAALKTCVTTYVACVDGGGDACRTPLTRCVLERLESVAATNDAGAAAAEAEAAIQRFVDSAAVNACLDQAEACYREKGAIEGCLSPAWSCLSKAFKSETASAAEGSASVEAPAPPAETGNRGAGAKAPPPR